MDDKSLLQEFRKSVMEGMIKESRKTVYWVEESCYDFFDDWNHGTLAECAESLRIPESTIRSKLKAKPDGYIKVYKFDEIPYIISYNKHPDIMWIDEE